MYLKLQRLRMSSSHSACQFHILINVGYCLLLKQPEVIQVKLSPQNPFLVVRGDHPRRMRPRQRLHMNDIFSTER